MSDLNTLLITNTGLINVNKKIIEERTYSSKLITKIGNPTIINGVASNFSSENYFTKAPLEFTDSTKIAINFKGKFFKSDNKQCPFEFITEAGNSIPLIFENNRVTLTYKSQEIFSFGSFNFEDEIDITIFLILKTRGYEFTMNYGSSVTQKTGDLNYTLPLSAIKTLRLGNSSKNEFWNGEIDLNKFSIYNNGEFLYAPSEGISWNFSHIIVSDGSAHLTDTTEPNDQNIYLFPIKNIARSGSTVLLTSEITEQAYLTIREIGLYVKTPEGTFLFGSIDKLNITKTGELSYNLAFSVNISVGVVNAIGFPAENGIVVKDPDFMEYQDYDTVQQVNTYVLTNLERIIRMNAGAKGKYSYENSAVEENQAGIGHNRPQVVYRLQQELEQMEDCYNSIDTFVKLVNRFQEVAEEQVDYNSFEIVGNLEVPTNGEVSGFTSSNYIKKETPFTDTSNWSLTTSFYTGENPTGTIISQSTRDSNTPSLRLEAYSSSRKLFPPYCSLTLRGTEALETSFNGPIISRRMPYIRDSKYDFYNQDETYYGWIYNEKNQNDVYYNFHCSNLSPQMSPIVSFPQSSSESTILEYKKLDPTNFTLSMKIKFGYADRTQYIIGRATHEDASFELLLENGKLKANLYEDATGYLITDSLKTRYELVSNKFYYVTLSYNGERYTLSYRLEAEGSEYPEEETIFVYSDKHISLGESTIVQEWSKASYSNGLGNHYWTSLAYGNGIWVAVSANGYISYSIDGTTWYQASYISTLGNNFWHSVDFDGYKFVALGQNGFISTSTNGTIWTQAIQINNLYINEEMYWWGITYGNNRFLAIDTHGYISTSIDGTTWEQAVQNPNLAWSDTDPENEKRWWVASAWDGTKFILIGESGHISTSEDGINWTETIQAANLASTAPGNPYDWIDIEWDGTKFTALERVHGYTSTSEDGINWTEPELNENLGDHTWHKIVWNGEKFLVIGVEGYISYNPIVVSHGNEVVIGEKYKAIDGMKYSDRVITGWQSAEDEPYLYSSNITGMVSYELGNESGIVVLTSDGALYSKVDEHASFTKLPNSLPDPNRPWTALTYGNEKFVAVNHFGHTAVSSNLNTWTVTTGTNLGQHNWNLLSYNGDKYLAIGENGYVSTSVDGKTWDTPVRAYSPTYHWKALSYGNGKFVLLSDSVFVSTSEDGINWTEPSPAVPLGNWEDITFDGMQFTILRDSGPYITISTSEDGINWTEPKMFRKSAQSPILYNRIVWFNEKLTGNSNFVILSKGSYVYSNISLNETLQGEIDFSSFSLSSPTDFMNSWIGCSKLDTIYIKSRIPEYEDTLYDNNCYPIKYLEVHNYYNELVPLYNYSLPFTFDIYRNTKYTLNLSYEEDEETNYGTYTLTSIMNDNESTKRVLLNKRLYSGDPLMQNRALIPYNTYIGVEPNTSNPFSGTVDLLDWNIKQGYNDWKFNHIVYLNSMELLQCYRMPNLNKNQYTVRDIHNFGKTIRFIENRFEGNDDLIDFSIDRGLTLCVKAHLEDAEPKVILYKSNLMNDIYCSLTFLNQTLAFTLATEQGVTTLSKALTLEEYVSYVNEPIMITVVFTPQTNGWGYIQMYKNNEALTDPTYIKLSSEVNPKIYTLSNFKQEMPTYEVTVDGEVVTKVVEPGRYVSDIVVIEGAISEEDLFYINNLYDTNY